MVLVEDIRATRSSSTDGNAQTRPHPFGRRRQGRPVSDAPTGANRWGLYIWAMSARLPRLIVALLVLVALAGAGWLAVRWLGGARGTAFGWAGSITTLAGGGERGFADGPAGRARFSDPFAVVVDTSGTAFVADAGETNRIRRIAPDGRTTTLPGAFSTPSGLAIDRAGNLYVADTGANRIRVIRHDGVVETLAGDGTAGFRNGAAGQAQFNGPMGVAVDAAGYVYVADTYNDRIRVITPDRQVRTLAGGAAPGFADGQGAAAAFDTPCALVVSAGGARTAGPCWSPTRATTPSAGWAPRPAS